MNDLHYKAKRAEQIAISGSIERQRALGDAMPARPPSALSGALTQLRQYHSLADGLAKRLRDLNDTLGGSLPTGDDAKCQAKAGQIGDVEEAASGIYSALYLIQCEIERLEGLVG